jgi:hypothetical protein
MSQIFWKIGFQIGLSDRERSAFMLEENPYQWISFHEKEVTDLRFQHWRFALSVNHCWQTVI